MITNTQFLEHQAYLKALRVLNSIKWNYSASVIEKLILLFGEANKGKTQSLMEVGIRLGMPTGLITTQNVRIILHYTIRGKVKIIFLSTYGDTVDDVMNNIRFYNMQIPRGCKVFEVKNNKISNINNITIKPDICIGASRVEKMHWDLYNRFVNSIVPNIPQPLMFLKTGTNPRPTSGALTQNDIDTINAIIGEL